ncbi:hypothetical protein, partial [Caballeronia calidae]|uniref:hypothetical protein n=1 Tax=Caballeronia calidae TaxID=1777139 RepID=UPI002FC7E2B3
FNINHSSLDHTFYPKSVSKKTGGAAVEVGGAFEEARIWAAGCKQSSASRADLMLAAASLAKAVCSSGGRPTLD